MLAKRNHELSVKQRDSGEDNSAAIKETTHVIEHISQLIYEMCVIILTVLDPADRLSSRHDKELTPIEEDGDPSSIKDYNSELPTTWFSAGWLFAECYLYRRLRSMFARTKTLRGLDPFNALKMQTFDESGDGVATLSRSFTAALERGEGKELDDETLHLEFVSCLQLCLWGNATDLSLLVNMSADDIKALQSAERGRDKVLANDTAMVWQHLIETRPERVDIIHDNAGYETITDWVLADFLVSMTGFVKEVHMHVKQFGWFVSDLSVFSPTSPTHTMDSSCRCSMPDDVQELLEAMQAPEKHFAQMPDEDLAITRKLGQRWQRHFDEGRFKLAVDRDVRLDGNRDHSAGAAFWTTAYPFSAMREKAPELTEELRRSSGLVIFKGDLNYRKLCSDAWWPTTTPFVKALGPLAGEFPLLSLRTLKADVIVGLPEGKAEELDRDEPRWRWAGKHAVVSYSPRKD